MSANNLLILDLSVCAHSTQQQENQTGNPVCTWMDHLKQHEWFYFWPRVGFGSVDTLLTLSLAVWSSLVFWLNPSLFNSTQKGRLSLVYV